jgi:hypothetical protein
MNNRLLDLVQKFPTQFQKFLDGETDLPTYLYEDLYDIFWRDMPYGTAKARTGDPYQWIAEKLFEELGSMEIV